MLGFLFSSFFCSFYLLKYKKYLHFSPKCCILNIDKDGNAQSKKNCGKDAKNEQSRAEQSRAEQSRAEQSRAEQSRAELYNCISVVVDSFLNAESYSQQKELLSALTSTWGKGVFPKNDKEIVGAIFALATIDDPRTEGIKTDAISTIWERTEGYALNLIKENNATYLSNRDNMEDILSSCKATVIAKIPNYDPYIGVPITFFDKDLKAAIREAISEITPGIKCSSYHIEKQKQIRRAINELKQRGIEPTAANINEYCLPDMPRNTILEEIKYMDRSANMISLDAEDAPDAINEEFESPEKILLNKERQDDILRLFRDVLTPVQHIILDALKKDADLFNKTGKLAEICGITREECNNEKASMVRNLTVALHSGAYGEDLCKEYVKRSTSTNINTAIIFDHDGFDDALNQMMDECIDIDLDSLNRSEVMDFFKDGRNCPDTDVSI